MFPIPTNFEKLFSDLQRSTSLRAIDLLDQLSNITVTTTGFPPSNIIQVGPHEWKIELAIAGIDPAHVKISTNDRILTVESGLAGAGFGDITDEIDDAAAAKATVDDKTSAPAITYPIFIKRGIATRNFKLIYDLPEYTQVTQASVDHGIMTITLLREVPEKQKPRVIPIVDSVNLPVRKRS